jgi:aryl-alcohol dehydrogenase-like predicted oxidoreductase
MATERSLERCGVDSFDLLLLHNPDRRGFESDAVWEALSEVRDQGLAGALGVAPGPANGFTLDLIGCFERHGELIDWAMVILNPFEPWPGELVLDPAARHDVRLITRVVDYGGLFHDDIHAGHEFAAGDHRRFRPEGWIEAGREKLDAVRPIAQRHDLTLLQLACSWNLAHAPVHCVAPTLIQEAGPGAKPIERKRAELAGVPADSMLLKGATPDHEGEERPDRWAVAREQAEVAKRWGIDPGRDLRRTPVPAG